MITKLHAPAGLVHYCGEWYALYVVEVTPEQATVWLADSCVDNQLDQAKVDQYASDMTAGRWRTRPDSFINFHAGLKATRSRGRLRLTDGHHRLTACVQSGASFRSNIGVELVPFVVEP